MINNGFTRATLVKVTGAALILVVAVALTMTGMVSFGQTSGPGDDPSVEPIPTLESHDTAQSVVLRVNFNSATDVEFVSGVVSQAPSAASIGAPPEIQIEVFDVDGALIRTLNDWHPLWVEVVGEDAEQFGFTAESGEGRFVFPFAPNIGIVIITDIELGVELIRIDARQIVLAYCATSPDDPGCPAAPGPGPGQLPDTGGTSSDGGSESWSWVAAIAAALALAGAAGATWLARRRLRAR